MNTRIPSLARSLAAKCLGMALLTLAGALPSHANLVLNGSFENNAAGGTSFNLSNGGLTALVSNVTGFGTAQEIDLITGGGFGLSPQDGQWKLGLHYQTFTGNYDAFSFGLSSPLVAGNSYLLAFYAANDVSGNASIEVGVSSAANTFGTSIFSSSWNSAGWQAFSQAFVAVGGESYLTVRTSVPDTYTSVDNFSLVRTGGQGVPDAGATAGLLGLGLLGVAAWRRRIGA